jgi:NAD(P)-dependent dehydrogenase (short-subunit alcohol dehydrogenase family)
MTGSVLVTGANSGIGLDTLRRFAGAGWSVTATVRNPARAAELASLLQQERLEARIVVYDALDRAATDAAIAQILSAPAPDVLINNAARTVFGPIELIDDAALDLQLETNVVAPLRLTRALIPHFRARGSGAIVNISSGNGFLPQGCEGVYSASKHAIEAIGEALYYELRPFGVRVAIVEPGRTAAGSDHKIIFVGGFGPQSAYWPEFQKRLDLQNATIWKDGWAEDPKVVAGAIFEAATSSEPRLHWQVGRDTRLAAQLRGRAFLDTYEERSLQALKALE